MLTDAKELTYSLDSLDSTAQSRSRKLTTNIGSPARGRTDHFSAKKLNKQHFHQVIVTLIMILSIEIVLHGVKVNNYTPNYICI